MTARPNRAVVTLAPAGPRTFGPAPGWMRCPVEVVGVTALPGESDLLSPSRGRTMTALMRQEAARLLPAEGRWEVEARLVGPGMIRVVAVLASHAEPDGAA